MDTNKDGLLALEDHQTFYQLANTFIIYIAEVCSITK